MDDILKQEKDFLRNVYCKIDNLEYEKRQQQLVKENEKQIKRRERISNIALSFLSVLVFSANIITDFHIFVTLLSFAFLMLVMSYYEFKMYR